MSNRTGYFIGIDGGGTQTRAIIVDPAGNELGMGTAGASNHQAVGVEAARENIRKAVAEAWKNAGLEQHPATAAFLGIAGVASAADRNTIRAIAQDLGLAMHIEVDHDIRTALAGGLAGEEGMALIAGTGSACYGRRNDGRSWRAGGWGHRLDDLGSGYWLGIQALATMTRGYDGRTEPASMAPTLMDHLGIAEMDDMLHLMGESGLTRAEIAALAPVVLQAAAEGDAVAHAIMMRGADELALMVQGVALKLGWEREPVKVVLIGGLVADELYAAAIRSAITRRVPNATPVMPLFPPVMGAALLAMELGSGD